MPKKLSYNGVQSTDLGLVIQTTPTYNLPERDVTTTHVPGRNGDIITDNGCYKNVTREYSLAKGFELPSAPLQGTVLNAQEIYEWLTSAKGKYARLEDDYDPTVYRLARFVGGGSITDVYDKALAYSASFDCKPQRYLKTGEVEITYAAGASVTINNLFHYEAKPKIKIENLPSGSSATTMASFKDSTNTETCLITLSNISSGETVIIDSEAENCYNGSDVEINDKVGLNGNNFPVLKKGANTISVAQYERAEYEIPSYSSMLSNKQLVTSSEYSPKDTTVKKYEDTYQIRAYKTMISEKETNFSADALQTRFTELCDSFIYDGYVTDSYGNEKKKEIANSYTISSFTTELEKDALTVTIPATSGSDWADFKATFGTTELGNYCEIDDTTTTLKLKVKTNSGSNYYNIWVLKGNKLKLYTNGQEIPILSSSKSADYTFYPCDTTDNSDTPYPVTLATVRADLPNWLNIVATTSPDSNDNDRLYISTINYNARIVDYSNGSTQRDCYIWTDKIGLTGIFGKAGWKQISDTNTIITYKWDTLKKGFTPNGSLLSKTDASYEIRFIVPSYTNATSNISINYDFGENAQTLFTIEVNSNSTMSTFKMVPALTGYYRISVGDNIEAWIAATAGTGNIGAQSGGYSTSKSFTVEYIKEIPSYKNESDWPEWLDPVPTISPSSVTIMLNADSLSFKVSQGSGSSSTAPVVYYRTYTTNDDGEDEPDTQGWRCLAKGTVVVTNLDVSDHKKVGHYYNTTWPNPNSIPEFTIDRAYWGLANPDYGTKPGWITQKAYMTVKLDSTLSTVKLHYTEQTTWTFNNVVHTCYIYGNDSDDPVCWVDGTWLGEVDIRVYNAYIDEYDHLILTLDEVGTITEESSIYLYSGVTQGGWYKYDNSTAWVQYIAGSNEPIAIIGAKDSITIYYLTKIWTYDEYYATQTTQPEWLDYFDITVLPANSNPLTVKFAIKANATPTQAGYYKLSTSVNWKYYAAGEEFTTILIGETMTLAKLVASSSSLSNVVIKITPNWWLL